MPLTRRSAEAQSRPIAVVAPRLRDSREGTTYVLRGFGCSFLDMRPIVFAFPLPSFRVCVSCKVVSARASRLSCGHTVCDACVAGLQPGQDVRREDVEAVPGRDGITCPVDGLRFADRGVLSLAYGLEQVGRELVRCLNARSGCPFVAELKHLKEHCLGNCRFRPRVGTGGVRQVPELVFVPCAVRGLQHLRP
uniref:TNF receptor-associated factor 6 n=1 Tax=Rhipicephalus zambeziensis TaxID=60191 RepID=A0A224Z1E2_9ACAR